MSGGAKQKQIGRINSAYGGLMVGKSEDKFFWSIEDHWGSWWEEIPESLYVELVKFEEARDKDVDATIEVELR